MKISAGFMMYRWNSGKLEVLLGHPGGPLYAGKDNGYWGIPKGHVEASETILAAAFREFAEETGLPQPAIGNLLTLGRVIERDGKIIYAWAFPGTCDTTLPAESNLFTMEWPPRSGVIQAFPEIDRLAFFDTDTAMQKIEIGQRQFIIRLEEAFSPSSSVI